MVIFFTGEQGLRVDVVSILRNLQVLVDPVSVLLDDVSVELVHSEFSAFPPCVHCTSPPGTHTSHSQVAEVLEELSFIDLADSVPSDWDEVSADTVGVQEEHRA